MRKVVIGFDKFAPQTLLKPCRTVIKKNGTSKKL